MQEGGKRAKFRNRSQVWQERENPGGSLPRKEGAAGWWWGSGGKKSFDHTLVLEKPNQLGTGKREFGGRR